MVNVEFLVVTYFVALFVDWIFQWEWQAVNKSKWSWPGDTSLSMTALLTHSLCYAILTSTIVSLIIKMDTLDILIMVDILLLSHIIIDTRIPVKWIMKFKGMSDEQINDYTNYGFMHIGIDHRLHELVILILSMIIK